MFFDEQVHHATQQDILTVLYALCPVCNSKDIDASTLDGTMTVRCRPCSAKIKSFFEISLGNPYLNRISAFNEATYDYVPKKNNWRTRHESIWLSGLKIEKNIHYDTYTHTYTVQYGNQVSEITPMKFIKKFSIKNWPEFVKKMEDFSSKHLYR